MPVVSGTDAGNRTTMSIIVCFLVHPRYHKQEQEMLHNTCDQCNDFVTQFATADGTVREERAHELLDTELAREVLAAIVGGRRPESLGGFGLKIGGAEAAGFFKEATGFDSESEVHG